MAGRAGMKQPNFARMKKKLSNLGTVDATPLMMRFRKIIEDDMRKQTLAGTAGADDHPLPKVTYRPKPGYRGKRHAAARKAARTSTNDNLTTAQYRLLDGPPLAPRRGGSRRTTKYQSAHWYDPGRKTWVAVGAWIDYVSQKGRDLIDAHIKGGKGRPPRDPRGLGRWGQEQKLIALKWWVQESLRRWARS